MDILWIWLKGLGIGFTIAAPVDPIGLLCMHQTLSQGWWMGLATGLGAATADALYGCVSALGLVIVSQFLVHHQAGIRILGGSFLAYLGIQSFRTPSPALSINTPDNTPDPSDTLESVLKLPFRWKLLWQNYASTFLLTLTNPATILLFISIFSLNDRFYTQSEALALVIGVFCGSSLWWLSLSSCVCLIRQVLSPQLVQRINQGAGGLIFCFGVAIVLQGLLQTL